MVDDETQQEWKERKEEREEIIVDRPNQPS